MSDDDKKDSRFVVRESAARELFEWLSKARILGFVAMIAPMVCAMAGSFNLMAGGVIGLASAIASVFMFKGVDNRRKELGLKYGFHPFNKKL